MFENNAEIQYNFIRKRFYQILLLLVLVSSCQNREQVSLDLEGVRNFDLVETLEMSNEINKPILLYFTGYACVNCKKMDENLLKDVEIIEYIKENFNLIPLYVDDPTKLDKEHWKRSIYNKRMVKHVGRLNAQLQAMLTQTGTQPIFAIVENEDGINSHIAYTRDRAEFLDFLKNGNGK